MDESQVTTQIVVVDQEALDENEIATQAAFFKENGDPFDIGVKGDTGDKGDKGDQGDPGATATGADVLLTGLTSGTATAPLATDSVNVAVANLQAEVEVEPTGADVLLTGLTSGSATAPLATDSVNVAIAKLQAEIDALAP